MRVRTLKNWLLYTIIWIYTIINIDLTILESTPIKICILIGVDLRLRSHQNMQLVVASVQQMPIYGSFITSTNKNPTTALYKEEK